MYRSPYNDPFSNYPDDYIPEGHKRDGYRHPVVINPGNVKINLDYFDKLDAEENTDTEEEKAKEQQQLKEMSFSSDYKQDVGIIKFFEEFAAGARENFLDMRKSSVHTRSEIMSNCLTLIFVLWLFSVPLFYGTPESNVWINIGKEGPMSDWHIAELCRDSFFLLILILGLISTLRPFATPIRFHKKNQEVYVYHKKGLYRIPWNECYLFFRHITLGSSNGHTLTLHDGFQLILVLSPHHAANAHAATQGEILLSLADCKTTLKRSIYGYAEYVRRYMNGTTPFEIRINSRPKQEYFNLKLALNRGYLNFIIDFILKVPFSILFKPLEAGLFYSPWRSKWPKEVHEWTGEKCNWH